MSISKGSSSSRGNKSASSGNRSEAGKKVASKMGHAKLAAAGRESGKRSPGSGRR